MKPFVDEFLRKQLRVTLSLLAGLLVCNVCMAAGDVVPDTIVFGGDSNYPPFELVVDNKPEGYNVELESAIAAAGQRKAKHRLESRSSAIRELEEGTVDIVPMFRTEGRAGEFHFSAPFHFADISVFAALGAPHVQGMIDLMGHKVAVERNSDAQQRLTTAGSRIEFIPVNGVLAALQEVVEGRAQYAVLNSLVAKHLVRARSLPIEQVGPPLWSDAYVFATRRDRALLSNWLDVALNRVVVDGTFTEIRERWEHEFSEQPRYWTDSLEYIGFFALPLLAAGGLVVGWNRTLSKRVRARTSDLRAELERRTEAERVATHLAHHDALSGLPRRDHFIELADAALAAKPADQQLDMLALHLENLGDVTRMFGHVDGDRIVRAFSDRLRALDVHIVGYFGGRTFGILAPTGQARSITDQLSNAISLPTLEFDPVVLIGIARASERGDGALSLLRRAETALDQGSDRRSVALYVPSMEPDPNNLVIVHDFRHTQGRGIHVVYQPQVSLADDSLVCCESLVRWNHGQLGPIPPERFIPLLEHSGLISILTRRMVEQAVSEAVSLRQEGFHCPIAVNISVQDLVEGDLRRTMCDALEHYGGRPEDIKVELTETSFADDRGGVSSALRALRDTGVRVSIDDFGTGYASLAYLSMFPVDEVKIDRMFIENMCTNQRHLAIVRSTISMAHDLGLLVVAEGAEEMKTVDALRNEGCDCVQGFVISRPLDLDPLKGWIRERNPAMPAGPNH